MQTEVATWAFVRIFIFGPTVVPVALDDVFTGRPRARKRPASKRTCGAAGARLTVQQDGHESYLSGVPS